MTSATSCNEEVRAESENKMLRENVRDLQEQLQNAYARITELNQQCYSLRASSRGFFAK
jgi:predicted RNase H-like nuclease (RuvC/YqgF family)